MIREAYELGMEEAFEKLSESHRREEHQANVNRHRAEVPAIIGGMTGGLIGTREALRARNAGKAAPSLKELFSFGKKRKALQRQRLIIGPATKGLKAGAKAGLIGAGFGAAADAVSRRWSGQVLREYKK